MDSRTVRVIMCCKGYGRGKDYAERIRNYMAKECDVPAERYSDYDLFNILSNAVQEFCRRDDAAAEFGREIRYWINNNVDLFSWDYKKMNLLELYSTVFHMLKVRGSRKAYSEDADEYLFGFTKEDLADAEKYLANC